MVQRSEPVHFRPKLPTSRFPPPPPARLVLQTLGSGPGNSLERAAEALIESQLARVT